MPHKSDKMSINNQKHDKRVKLTDDDKEKIKKEYATGLVSQRDLAKKYGVSRRTVQFALDPEKLERTKKQFAERQKEGRYYDKDKHKEYMRKHREYKKDLYNKGLLKE
ncbi:hypothetical protein ACP8H2_09830 [Bacillus subtilis]|uniref:hypothetical protein n=1 Tax=Bacillus subtilis TaxID=1423 RepID=UPI003CF4C710